MGSIVAFANQKGGIGKTTSAINVAAAIAKKGKAVLLIDSDPQGNTTSGLGMNVKDDNSVYDLLMGKKPYKKCCQKTEVKNLSILGADIRRAGAEVELVDMEEREFFLKKILDTVRDQYDFVFIDIEYMENFGINGAIKMKEIAIRGDYIKLEQLLNIPLKSVTFSAFEDSTAKLVNSSAPLNILLKLVTSPSKSISTSFSSIFTNSGNIVGSHGKSGSSYNLCVFL